MALRVRALTDEEKAEIGRRERSRTAAARAVERAKIIALAAEGKRVPVIAAELGLSAICVRQWLVRFNEHGLDGLTDAPRSGRPATYRAKQVGEVVAASLTKPQALGLPFAAWTLDRLAAYMHEGGFGLTPQNGAFGRHYSSSSIDTSGCCAKVSTSASTSIGSTPFVNS